MEAQRVAGKSDAARVIARRTLMELVTLLGVVLLLALLLGGVGYGRGRLR
jgi:hypothetical protein